MGQGVLLNSMILWCIQIYSVSNFKGPLRGVWMEGVARAQPGGTIPMVYETDGLDSGEGGNEG